jgi:hypothetical protein
MYLGIQVNQSSEHNDLIGLLGDINAKTGKLLDYVETDKSLLTIFDLQDDVDLINYMYDYENIVNAGSSLSRNSNCTGRPNTYGHMLLMNILCFPGEYRCFQAEHLCPYQKYYYQF